jgi:hypothetical protein
MGFVSRHADGDLHAPLRRQQFLSGKRVFLWENGDGMVGVVPKSLGKINPD